MSCTLMTLSSTSFNNSSLYLIQLSHYCPTSFTKFSFEWPKAVSFKPYGIPQQLNRNYLDSIFFGNSVKQRSHSVHNLDSIWFDSNLCLYFFSSLVYFVNALVSSRIDFCNSISLLTSILKVNLIKLQRTQSYH